jgi:hypothetical protein
MTAPSIMPDAPYRGIEPFRYIDHPIFFERKKETQKLLRLVTIHRGVLLYGDSGVGKSSLINAGLIPAIENEDFRPDRLRVQLHEREPIVIERISMTANNKAPYLPSIFADGDEQERVVLSVAEFKEKLNGIDERARPLLIFDQFEEIVTLFEEAPRKSEREAALCIQENILMALGELLRKHTLPVKLLFVFREDYLAKLTKLFELYPELPDQYLRLKPPSTKVAYEIIRGPFKKFSWPSGSEITSELARALAEAIRTESEGAILNLSEVQIVCLKLWRSKEPSLLFNEKGIRGLLEDYLSDAFEQIGAELSDPAIALLSRMVTASGARLVISEDDLIGSVHEKERISQDILRKALTALEGTKLAQRELQREVDYFEIASEFLVPWITAKKAERLERIKAERLKQEAERLLQEEKSRADSERRKRQAIDIRKKRRAYKTAGISIAVAVIVALSAALIIHKRTVEALASAQVQQAIGERAAAQQQRDTALQERDRLSVEKNQADKEKEEALALKKGAETDRDNVITAMRGMNNRLKLALFQLEQVDIKLDQLNQNMSDPQSTSSLSTELEAEVAKLRNQLYQLKQASLQYPAPQHTP